MAANSGLVSPVDVNFALKTQAALPIRYSAMASDRADGGVQNSAFTVSNKRTTVAAIESAFIDYKSKLALVIDDYPSMRSAFKMALASFGMTRVDLAASGSEALMRVKGAKYDVIISDYNLGEGRDGQQVLEEMRHRNLIGLETAFLMVTAESVYERVVAAAELAPDDYLIKPFNGEIMRTRLEAILLKKEAFRSVHRHFAQGDLESALAGCDTIMKTYPKYLVDAMRFKGEVLMAMGNFEGAEALYKQILAMRAVPWSRLGLARALHLQRKEPAAEELLLGIVDQHPELVASYDLLADVQLTQNKLKDAQNTLQRGVTVSSQSSRRQRRLGEVAYLNNDLDNAESAFQAAIEKGKNSVFLLPNDFANLSRVYLEQGNAKAASTLMVDNRKLLQESDAGKLIFAVVQSRCGARPEEARSLMEEAVRLKQSGVRCEPELALDMVQTCLAVGLEAEAASLLDEVARNAHDSTALLEKAKRIYREAGKEAIATDILKKATEQIAKLARDGALLLQRGNLKQGATRLLQAAEAAPRNPRVLMNAAWALLRLIEQQGNSGSHLADAKRLLADAAYLAPEHPRLAGLQTMLRGVESVLAQRGIAAFNTTY